MAKIDLKNASVFIRDGYAGPTGPAFLVNNMSGYTAGAVTMTVDGGTGIIQTSDRFTVAGDTVVHRVTAHTETASATTSITFTPALGAMVADDAEITFLPHELEVKIGEGNISWTEKRNMVYEKDRGNLDTVREGDQEPVDVRIDFTYEFLRSAAGAVIPTVKEALTKTGFASIWESSSDDPCEPYAVDIEILHEPPCSGEPNERVLLSDYRWENLEHDPKAATVSSTGKCHVTAATVTREAA